MLTNTMLTCLPLRIIVIALNDTRPVDRSVTPPAPDSAGVHGEQLLRVMPKGMLSKMGRASRQRSVHRPWALHRYRRQIVLLSHCVEQADLVQMALQSFPPSRGAVPTWRQAGRSGELT